MKFYTEIDSKLCKFEEIRSMPPNDIVIPVSRNCHSLYSISLTGLSPKVLPNLKHKMITSIYFRRWKAVSKDEVQRNLNLGGFCWV